MKDWLYSEILTSIGHDTDEDIRAEMEDRDLEAKHRDLDDKETRHPTLQPPYLYFENPWVMPGETYP